MIYSQYLFSFVSYGMAYLIDPWKLLSDDIIYILKE